MLNSLYLKLIGIGVSILLIAGMFFYISNLKKEIKKVERENTIVQIENNNHKANIEETERRTVVVDRVTAKVTIYEKKQVEKYNETVKAMEENKDESDRPVGPLLRDYFNGMQSADTPTTDQR